MPAFGGTVRNGFLDYCRLAAALGIVWFHCKAPGQQVAYAALPFFIVLLSLPSRSRWQDRARRLLIPFFIWSAVYAGLQVALAWQAGQPPLGWWQPSMLLTGTVIHLWFLPFAFFFALAAPVLSRAPLAATFPVLAAGALGLIGPLQTWPWYQWGFALVPALVGLAYVRSGLVALPALVVAWLVLETFHPSPDNLTILAGSALAIGAMLVRMPATLASDWCARIAMQVYLSHVLIILWGKVLGLSGYVLGVFGLVFALAFAVCLDGVLQRVNRWRGKSALTPARS
jgi:fucose 4-O-acetylase-like acetyltransferase